VSATWARRLSVLLVFVCVLCVLGGVWWWALFGLSAEVGQALAVTVFVALVVGFGLGMWADLR
jgi:hypothetical protein